MKRLIPLSFLLLILSIHPSSAQFFEKIDEDFKFNGTDLGALNYDQTKNCTLLEETESYRIYIPKNDVVKTKHFTLQDIYYYTDFRNQIWQIEAINTGDVVEKAHIRTDMSSGAKSGDKIGADTSRSLYYRHMRTTNVYQQEGNSDTAVIAIIMAWYISQTEDYRIRHSFLPMIGKPVKNDYAKEFLFAYQIPENRSRYEELKWLKYYRFGLELYLRSDTIMQATVFNVDKKYKKYAGGMPYDLSIDDSRKAIREKLGAPPSTSGDGATWYYTRDDMQVHVTFTNVALKREAGEDDKVASIVFALKK